MPHRTLRAAAAGVALIAGLGAVNQVSAHALKRFGTYTVAIGWLHEPAYVGFDNAVQVIVKDAQQKPVGGLDSLTVDVALQSQSMNGLKLTETADPDTGLGTPGDYEVHFIPTAPGNYTFHLHGNVNGTSVDESVTAGDRTFDLVRSATDAEFPVKVPALVDLSRKVDAVSTRQTGMGTRLDSAQQAIAGQQSGVDDAKSAATHAEVLAIIALIVGLLAGAAGFFAGRRVRGGTSRPS